jgi:hypothetical protein
MDASMSNVNLDLHFASLEVTNASQGNAVQVYVKGTYGEGISRPCATFRELDIEITRLQKELEALRAKGRKRFTKLQAA